MWISRGSQPQTFPSTRKIGKLKNRKRNQAAIAPPKPDQRGGIAVLNNVRNHKTHSGPCTEKLYEVKYYWSRRFGS